MKFQIKKKLLVGFLWILAFSFLNTGCIAFHPDQAKRDSDGHYIRHYSSCGPIAIKKSLRYFDVRSSAAKISKKIQSSGNLSRTAMMFAHYKLIQVTFPCEVKQYYESNGYEVTEIDDINKLKNNDIAIVLVRGNILNDESYHWLCYPSDTRIVDFYGENTKILRIYVITKK